METVYVKIKDDTLAHHGIKGQRWGVRRYQNADGSLTSSGRSHYGVGEARKKTREERKSERAEQKAKKKQTKARAEVAQKRLKEKAERDRRMKTGPGAASEAVKMTPKEIKKLTEQYRNANEYMKERSQLDTYIDKYSPKEPTKTEKIVEAFNKAQKVASSINTIYDLYSKVTGKTSVPTEKELIDLEKSKIDLKKATLQYKNLQTERTKKLEDEAVQADIDKGKALFALMANTMSQETMDDYYKRYETRNKLIEEMFKYKK